MKNDFFMKLEAHGSGLKIEATITKDPYGGPVIVPFKIEYTPTGADSDFMGGITVSPAALERKGKADHRMRYEITIREVPPSEWT